MKTLRYIIVLLALVSLPIMQGCDLFRNKCNVDFNFLTENAHHFTLFDYYTGEQLLRVGGEYRRDSVKVFDADGNVYFGGPARTDGLIYFELLTRDDQGIVEQRVVRELYLYLNQYDTDTLRYEFEMRKDECGYQFYHYVKLTYNDSVYVDEFNRWFPYRELYKK